MVPESSPSFGSSRSTYSGRIDTFTFLIVCLLFIVYPFLNLIVQSFHDADTNAFTFIKIHHGVQLQRKYQDNALEAIDLSHLDSYGSQKFCYKSGAADQHL